MKKRYWPFLVIALIAIIMVLPQVLTKGLILENDSIFHFNRIFDTYQQFKTHNINYYQMNYSFQQSGRVINAVYGPIFSYVLGLVLLVCGSWLKFQLVTLCGLYFISGVGMYLLAKRVHSSNIIGICSSALFMGSPYIIAWGLSQQFTAWGMMLMPYVFLSGIDMIDSDRRVNVLLLSVSVAAIIQVHMLSSLFVVLALVPFFVVGLWQNENRLQLVLRVVISAGVALLLSLNVIAMMIELFKGNHIISPFPNVNMQDYTGVLSLSIPSISAVNLGFILTVVTVIHWLLFLVLPKNRIISTIAITGAMFFVMSSPLIPWHVLSRSVPMLMTFLQFPVRLLSISITLTLAGLAYQLTALVKQNRSFAVLSNTFIITCAVCSMAIGCWQLHSVSVAWFSKTPIQRMTNLDLSRKASAHDIRNAFKSPDLALGLELVEKESPDYLPSKIKLDPTTYTQVHPYYQYRLNFIQPNGLFNKSVDGNNLVTTWTSKTNQQIQVPVAKYRNTKMVLNGRVLKNKDFESSMIGAVVLTVKKGVNKLVTSYEPSFVTQIAVTVSLLSWIGMFAACVVLNIRKKYVRMTA